MYYAYRNRLHSTDAQPEILQYHRDACTTARSPNLSKSRNQQGRLLSACAKFVDNYLVLKTGGTSGLTYAQLSHKLP